MKIQNLQLETGYLVEPVTLHGGLPVHQIQITSVPGEAPSKVVLTLDPNRCTVDSFGEPKACTRMASLSIEATLELLEECERRCLFGLKFEGAGPALRLALLPPCNGKDVPIARLLVFGDKGEPKAILPLQFSSASCVVV